MAEDEKQQPPKKPGQAQSISLKEYMQLQAKEAKKKKGGLPLPVKLILLSPLIIIGLLGIFLVPYFIYSIAVSPESKSTTNPASPAYQEKARER